MPLINAIKERLPDYAKDIRLNLDAVIGRSSLAPTAAAGARHSPPPSPRSRRRS